MTIHPHILAPPWGIPARWHEANHTVDYLIHLRSPELAHAVALAREIERRLESIFPLMDDLCAVTCSRCPDPCCMAATVWLDFRDILFLHLTRQHIPPAQLIQEAKDTCRYLGLRGCTLPRIVRPWVCTCYLCPPQAANLRRKVRPAQNIFNQTVQAIKIGRRDMEDEFIRVTS